MKRNAIVFAILVVAVGMMLVSAIFFARNTKDARIAGNPTGQIAADFELVDLSGKTVKLSDFRGKAVLLNFWATWCSPCKVEMPWFVDLQQRYGPEGLVVLGVAMDDSGKDVIAEFANEMNVNYTVLLGKEAVADAYGSVQFLPTTFYIDRQGKVIDRVFGLVSRKEIEDNVKKALSTSSAAESAPVEAADTANADPGERQSKGETSPGAFTPQGAHR